MITYIPPFPFSSSSLYFPGIMLDVTNIYPPNLTVCAVLTTHRGGLNTNFPDGGALGEVLDVVPCWRKHIAGGGR